MKDFDQALADLINEHIGEGIGTLISAMVLQIIALRKQETREQVDTTSPRGDATSGSAPVAQSPR
jgi:hypothetical protein